MRASSAWHAGGVAGALLLVVACSNQGDDHGAITPDDQRQLNEAAAILDANTLDAPVTGAHESSPHD